MLDGLVDVAHCAVLAFVRMFHGGQCRDGAHNPSRRRVRAKRRTTLANEKQDHSQPESHRRTQAIHESMFREMLWDKTALTLPGLPQRGRGPQNLSDKCKVTCEICLRNNMVLIDCETAVW